MNIRRTIARAGALLALSAAGACGTVQSEVTGSGQPVDRAPVVQPSVPPVPTASAPPVPPVPVPEAVPAVVVMPASVPVRVEVASITVDSELMELGLQDDGTLEVPPGAFPAGWYSGAPTPGELGPAVIVGHIDWVTGPGVFYRLGALEVGAEIRVSRADGTVAVFRTTEVTRYPKDGFPTDLVYGDIEHAGLRLISCGGQFNERTGHYEDNIVAFAELVT